MLPLGPRPVPVSVPYAFSGEVREHKFLSLNAVLQPNSNDEAWATLTAALSVFNHEVQRLGLYSTDLLGGCEGYFTRAGGPPSRDALSFDNWSVSMVATWKALGVLICSTGVDKTVLSQKLSEDRLGKPCRDLLLEWAPAAVLDGTAASFESDIRFTAAHKHREDIVQALVRWRNEDHAFAGRNPNDPEYASYLGQISSTASQLASHLQQMAAKYGINFLAIKDTEEEPGDGTPDCASDAEDGDSGAPMAGKHSEAQLEDRTSTLPSQQYPTHPVPSQKVLDDVLVSLPLLAEMLTLSNKHLRGLAVRWAFAAKAAKRRTKKASRVSSRPKESSGAGPSSSLTL